MKIAEDDIILFSYRNREVKCIVIHVSYHNITGKLMIDYIGKNITWYTNENKSFQRNLMKNIIKL